MQQEKLAIPGFHNQVSLFSVFNRIFESYWRDIIASLFIVNYQFEYIWTCIMSNHIMLHFAGDRQTHVKFCVDDGFFIPDWFCQIMSIRVDNTASSPANTNAILQMFFMSFMLIDLLLLQISICRF